MAKETNISSVSSITPTSSSKSLGSVNNETTQNNGGDTYQTIQNILRGKDESVKLNIGENILHDYDNYNYHIKFYMTEQGEAQKYMDKRRSLNNNSYENMSDIYSLLKSIKQKSVIIAETGKTEDIIIDSMTIDTITSTPVRGISTTAELTLNITEIGGCSLINKITYASKCLGQESYVKSVYFVDLWFSGYTNKGYTKKTIEEKIPFTAQRHGISKTNDSMSKTDEEEFLTFAMIPSDVKVKQNGLNTQYTFKMVGLNFNLHIPSVSTTNMEKLEIKKGGTFKTTVEDFEKKLNEALKETLTKGAKEIYGNEEIVKFNIIDDSEKKPADKSITETESNENSPQNVGTQNVGTQNSTQIINSVTNMGSNGEGQQPITQNSSESDGGTSKTKSDFAIDRSDNISTAITKIWNIFHPLSGCIPFIDITQTSVSGNGSNGESSSESSTTASGDSVGSSKKAELNMLYPKYMVDIHIKEFPGLEIRKKGMTKNAKPAWTETIIEEQKAVLEGLSKENAIKRRYFNNYTGKNYDVLDYTENDDTLWYLNTSIGEQNLIIGNKKNVSSKDENKNESQEKTDQENNVFKPGQTINDLWDMRGSNGEVIDVIRNGAVGPTNIFEPQKNNTQFGENKEEETKSKNDAEDEKQSIARIGAENFFSKAQKIQLKATIIGDPYWLEFGSEMRGTFFSNAFPHVIFVANTPYKLDKKDNYVQDPSMIWASLYRVLKIKSKFESGKFTQEIEGVIAPSFVFKDNFKSYREEKADTSVASVADTNTEQDIKLQGDDISIVTSKEEEIQKGFLMPDMVKKEIVKVNGEDKLQFTNSVALKYYYDNKNNRIVFMDEWNKNNGEYASMPLDKYDVVESNGTIVAIDKETGTRYVYDTIIGKINPNAYGYSSVGGVVLSSSADSSGIINDKNISLLQNSDGSVSVYRNDANVGLLPKNMYNVETIGSGETVSYKVTNKNTGQTVLLKDVENSNHKVVKSFESSETNTKDNINYVVGFNDNLEDTMVVYDSSKESTKLIQLGHFDRDGSKSSFVHDYSQYAEVTTNSGKKVKCYSEEELKEAMKYDKSSNVVIKREFHDDGLTVQLGEYNNMIEKERLDNAYSVVNKGNKAVHNDVVHKSI